MSLKLVDVHSHPFLPAYRQALAKIDGTTPEQATIYGDPVPEWSATAQIEAMDRRGISKVIFSQTSAAHALVGREGRALCRAMNEELAAVVQQFPDRFAAFGVVPMDDMDAALSETAYALDVLKFDGITASTSFGDDYLGDRTFDPWFDEMDRRGVTLFVHPTASQAYQASPSNLNASLLEFMFDTTRMVATMVLSGAKQRFNAINIIATHGGGTIPYLAPRLAMSAMMPNGGYGPGSTLSSDDILASLGSFYFDLTAATSAAQLDALRGVVPCERLLMGFDYPMMPEQTIAPAVRSLEVYGGFSDTEKAKILSLNALQLFPRFQVL